MYEIPPVGRGAIARSKPMQSINFIYLLLDGGGSVVVDLLFYVPPVVCGVLRWPLFWYALLYVLSSFAIILTR